MVVEKVSSAEHTRNRKPLFRLTAHIFLITSATMSGAFYESVQNVTTSQILIPSTNLIPQMYQNINNVFTSVVISSDTQCLFSLQTANATVLFTCYNITSTASSSKINGTWLTSPLQSFQDPANSVKGVTMHERQAQVQDSAATSAGPQIASAVAAPAATTTTTLPAPVGSLGTQPQATGASAREPQSCISPCDATGVLLATQSHVLLLGWPSAESVYHGRISDAESDAATLPSSPRFSLLPVSNSISFNPGTAVSTGPDTFAYLTYGKNPELQFYNISSDGSLTLTLPLINALNGTNSTIGNMLLVPGQLSTSDSSPGSNSSSMLGKRAGSSWIAISILDNSEKLSVMMVDPTNPNGLSPLNNGDTFPGTSIPTSTVQDSGPSSASPNIGAIVGGVIGGVVLIAICMGLLIFFRRRSRHRKYNVAQANSRAIQPNEYNNYIDERPSQHSTPPLNMVKFINQPLVNKSHDIAGSSYPIPAISPLSFSPIISRSTSKTLLPDYTQRLLQEMNITFTEYSGSDARDLQTDLKGGAVLFNNRYVLTNESAIRLSASYSLRTASKLPDKTEQVSIHFFKEAAQDLQLAQVGFATKLHGPNIVNHIQSYILPNNFRSGFETVSITEICSPTKSLSRLIHPAPGDLALADATDRYFQKLTIKSLLQTIRRLHSNEVCHLGLSVNSFFHEGGDVTEWKLGKLEDCKVVDDYLGDCDVIETTAPEVLNNQETNVTKESSIWSLGVVIYELVAGAPLFKTVDVARQFAKSGRQPNLDTVKNENAMLLLAKMLVLKPMQRGNIEELFHFWEAHEEHADHEDDDDISSIEG